MEIRQRDRHKHVETAKKMRARDHLIEVELVKQLALVAILLPHHARASRCSQSAGIIVRDAPQPPFSTASVNRVISRARTG